MSVLLNPATDVPFPELAAPGGVTTRVSLGAIALCGTTAGAVTVQRPSPRVQGSVFAVVDADGAASTNPITVDGDGDLLDGAATVQITEPYQSVIYVYDLGAWRRIVGRRRVDGVAAELELERDTAPIPSLPSEAFGSLIFRPGVPSGGNHVATWAEVETAIAAASGLVVVVIDNDLAPCVVPATADTECFGRVHLSAVDYISGAVLTIANGGRLRNLGVLEQGLAIEGAPSGAGPIPLLFTSPGLLLMREGATVRNTATATKAMIQAGTNLVLSIIEGSFLDNSAVPLVPVVQVDAGFSMTCVALAAVPFAAFLTPTTIAGDATSSLAFAHDASVEFVAQSLFVGAVLEIRTNQSAALQPSTGATAGRPLLPFAGQEYFDTTLGFPVWWNGAAWVGADGIVHP